MGRHSLRRSSSSFLHNKHTMGYITKSLPEDKIKIMFYAQMMFIQNFGFFLMYYIIYGAIPELSTCSDMRFWIGWFAVDRSSRGRTAVLSLYDHHSTGPLPRRGGALSRGHGACQVPGEGRVLDSPHPVHGLLVDDALHHVLLLH